MSLTDLWFNHLNEGHVDVLSRKEVFLRCSPCHTPILRSLFSTFLSSSVFKEYDHLDDNHIDGYERINDSEESLLDGLFLRGELETIPENPNQLIFRSQLSSTIETNIDSICPLDRFIE